MSVFLSGGTGSTGGSMLMIVLYLAFFIVLMYFLMIRPQKKQAKKQDELQNSLEPGDNIMTTSGFFGTILDIVDDTTVIVEFGNNKNCRIPMHKRRRPSQRIPRIPRIQKRKIQKRKIQKRKIQRSPRNRIPNNRNLLFYGG